MQLPLMGDFPLLVGMGVANAIAATVGPMLGSQGLSVKCWK